ncbi:hypothetical protein [Ideonella sp.]|uniref:hypothetical protein n=1 Tax=Ideonella sp. TaxID=1929293 RepID=UPI002B4AAB17|nr:hypothetical protein [Ideonella sp.]HJV71294.1 hypothetical protein [Ideonella sp.]
MHGAFILARGRFAAALLGLLGVLSGLLGGCSPALDWREVRLAGPGLVAMFPCRPVGQTRQLTLAGTAVTMTLQACEAADRTFAVGLADMGDPAAVDAGLQALRDASLAKSGGTAQPAVSEWSVEGMTPQPAAGRWQLSQPQPAGGAVHVDTAVFARGTWVVQATVIAKTAGAAANAPFFEGLRLTP